MADKEIQALTAIDSILAKLEDPGVRDRVLRWAWEKYSSQPPPDREEVERAPRKNKKRKRDEAGRGKRSSTRGGTSIVRDLNLRPAGKMSFKDFADQKAPPTNGERCTVAAYYLVHKMSLPAATASHIFTCFKEVSWRAPANLTNTLAATAHKTGWLDTADMEDIKVTPRGDNLVEHDLPRPSEKAGDPTEATTRKSKKRARKKAPKKSAALKGEKKTVRSGGRPGPTAMLNELVTSGYFSKPRTIGGIIEHCAHDHAHRYKATDFSPTLARAVRSKKLKRAKNAEGQFEYRNA